MIPRSAISLCVLLCLAQILPAQTQTDLLRQYEGAESGGEAASRGGGYRDLLQSGAALLKERKYEEAVKVLSAAISVQPNSAAAFRLRALVYETASQTEFRDLYDEDLQKQKARSRQLAIADLSSAIQLGPIDYQIYLKRAQLRARDEQLANALEDVNQAIRLAPHTVDDLAPCYLARAQIYSDMIGDMLGETVRESKAQVQHQPFPHDVSRTTRDDTIFVKKAHVRESEIFSLRDKIIQDCSTILRLRPMTDEVEWNALLKRSLTYKSCGRYEEALTDINKMLTQRFANDSQLHERADCYFALGRYEEALSDFNVVEEHWRARIAELKARNAWEYQLFGNQSPLAANERCQQAICILNRKDYGKVRTIIDEVLHDDADYWHPHYVLALMHERLGQDTEAIAAYSQSIRLAPYKAEVYIGRGRVLKRQGQFSEAAKDLETAASLTGGMVSLQAK